MVVAAKAGSGGGGSKGEHAKEMASVSVLFRGRLMDFRASVLSSLVFLFYVFFN